MKIEPEILSPNDPVTAELLRAWERTVDDFAERWDYPSYRFFLSVLSNEELVEEGSRVCSDFNFLDHISDDARQPWNTWILKEMVLMHIATAAIRGEMWRRGYLDVEIYEPAFTPSRILALMKKHGMEWPEVDPWLTG